MPSTALVLRAVFYALVSFLPPLLMLVYPFRNRLRISDNLAAVGAALLAAAFLCVTVLPCFGLLTGSLPRIILIVAVAGFYIAAVQDSLWRVILNLILVSALCGVAHVASAGLSEMLFQKFASESFNWVSSVILLLLQAVMVALYIPLHRNLVFRNQKTFSPETEAPESTSQVPEEVTEVPLAECNSTTSASILPEDIQDAFKKLEFAPPAGTAPVFAPVCNREQLRFQQLQDRLQVSQEGSLRISSHFGSLLNLLEQKDIDALRKELSSLQELFSGDKPVCSEPIVCGLVTMALRASKCLDIRMTTDISLPSNLSMECQELTVLLGNLLDNALEACISQTHLRRRIHFYAHYREGSLQIAVKNTCETPPRREDDGTFLSSKYEGPGQGLQEVRQIVARHNGNCDIRHGDDFFQVGITIQI